MDWRERKDMKGKDKIGISKRDEPSGEGEALTD